MAAYESIDVLLAADRSTTVGDGVTTRHLLSFGSHYDPARTSIGPIVAYNDEALDSGRGYPAHRHSGVEIVSWVVRGRLAHTDATGSETVLEAGSAQVLGAGQGVVHAEHGAEPDGARFVQLWLTSDEPSADPRYASAAFDEDDLRERWVAIAGGRSADTGTQALPLRSSGATCFVGRIAAGEGRALPSAAGLHVYVVAGSVVVGDVRLDEGDSALLRRPVGARCDAAADSAAGAEVLVWALDGP